MFARGKQRNRTTQLLNLVCLLVYAAAKCAPLCFLRIRVFAECCQALLPVYRVISEGPRGKLPTGDVDGKFALLGKPLNGFSILFKASLILFFNIESSPSRVSWWCLTKRVTRQRTNFITAFVFPHPVCHSLCGRHNLHNPCTIGMRPSPDLNAFVFTRIWFQLRYLARSSLEACHFRLSMIPIDVTFVNP